MPFETHLRFSLPSTMWDIHSILHKLTDAPWMNITYVMWHQYTFSHKEIVPTSQRAYARQKVMTMEVQEGPRSIVTPRRDRGPTAQIRFFFCEAQYACFSFLFCDCPFFACPCEWCIYYSLHKRSKYDQLLFSFIHIEIVPMNQRRHVTTHLWDPVVECPLLQHTQRHVVNLLSINNGNSTRISSNCVLGHENWISLPHGSKRAKLTVRQWCGSNGDAQWHIFSEDID